MFAESYLIQTRNTQREQPGAKSLRLPFGCFNTR
uniref:Uncharacterized protein n=2 Tax=unclassified Caudoviricetes TaxID=2788787 RepID=A0A8S5NN56_9CAUD|nr:MAG TPA: hypothetical protein [Myoviridae sp. ctzRR1]DAD96237.1 MAG TPA: hypothetical protein [Myoviridae sp. ct0mM28]